MQSKRKSAKGEAASRLNSTVAWTVFWIVAMSAVPFGSNRPFFWAVWGVTIGCVGLWYRSALWSRGLGFPFPPFRYFPLMVLFVLLSIYSLCQIIPIGDLVPLSANNQFEQAISLRFLSVAPGDSYLALLRWMTYGGLFFLTVQSSRRRDRTRRIMQCMVIVTTLEAAYALAALSQFGDTILFFEKTSYQGMATGTFINRNSMATYLGLGIVIAVSLVMESSGQRRSDGSGTQAALLLLAIFIMGIALILSQSRMGILVTLVGMLLTAVIGRRHGTNAILLAALTLGVLGVVGAIYGAGVFDRLLVVERSADSRLELYRQIMKMVAERPILGYGGGSFQQAFQLFREPSLPPQIVWQQAHSTYLSLWVGYGLIVGSIPLLVVGVIITQLWRMTIRSGQAISAERSAALGATVVIGLHSSVDFSVEIQAVAMIYTWLLGIAYSQYLEASIKPGPQIGTSVAWRQ